MGKENKSLVEAATFIQQLAQTKQVTLSVGSEILSKRLI